MFWLMLLYTSSKPTLIIELKNILQPTSEGHLTTPEDRNVDAEEPVGRALGGKKQ